MSEATRWFQSPNESPGEIHPIAKGQLAQKQDLVLGWPTWTDNELTVGHERCCKCNHAIFKIWHIDLDGRPSYYTYNEDEMSSLIVAHVSIFHPEVFNGID